ncbi:MAG: leucine-rich repeat domain-containing protein [Clostridia bacterium]|nr:leucine-rich repeat domain-containing protein [Clostridia bacterium]
MKKKFLLTLVMVMMFVLVLAFAVSAESFHDGKVDLNQKVTLSDGTECALFDADGDALIWYLDANGALQSIKAQDERVKYNGSYDFGVGNSTVGSVQAFEVNKIEIALESGTLACNRIVVFNAMDDDVKTNTGSRLDKAVNCLRSNTFINSTNLQYAFLRLDTVAVQAAAFQGCTNLKYVNLENLTELRQIGGGSCFNGCTSLMVGEVLDLSNTKLCVVGGSGVFNNVKLAGVILPNTVTDLGDWNFQGMSLTSFAIPTGVTSINNSTLNDCKSLTTVYINNTLTKVNNRVFNNTALEKIFYVGTLDQLNTLLDNSSTENNAPFWAVVGDNRANLISYEDYQKLEDKSGKYVVYDYSYCEAYAGGVHALDPEKSNACAGICGICGAVALAQNPVHDYVTTLVYANYLANGTKTQTCQNEGCPDKATPVVTSTDPIITSFKGFSVNYDGDAITFGYVFNEDAIKEFEEVNGTTVEFGFVAGVKALLGDKMPLDEGAANVVKAVVDSKEYVAADFILRGNWDKMVDLDGDEVAETDVKEVEFYMAGYMLVNGNVVYLNANGSSANAGVITFEGCDQPEIVE